MTEWRRTIVWSLIWSVSLLPVSDSVLWAKAAAPVPVEQTKQSVNLLGEGAQVKVKLTDGAKLKGAINQVNDEGFTMMAENWQTPRTIAYDQIAELKPAKRSYKASGEINAPEARRAVVGLGVGEHIMVKFDGNRELHGNIRSIGMDRFTILPDNEQTPVEVAYDSVQVVHKNLSAGATLVLVLAVAAAAIIAAVVATGSDTVRGAY
ncbi:MAG: hypothetical protein ACE145_00290 [Terriglobia bacterium]